MLTGSALLPSLSASFEEFDQIYRHDFLVGPKCCKCLGHQAPLALAGPPIAATRPRLHAGSIPLYSRPPPLARVPAFSMLNLKSPLYQRSHSYLKLEGIMRRSEILQNLAVHRGDLIQLGVKTLAVFGSVARDEARPDSDVDLLVEFQDKGTFDGYMDLKFYLEDLLGHPVDLVTKKSIRPKLKTQIESEAFYVQGLPALS
jgi:predicted nucleotidyltransferase